MSRFNLKNISFKPKGVNLSINLGISQKIEKILGKIDSFFESRKASERTIIQFSPALLALFVSYSYLFPIIDSSLLKDTNELKRVSNEIITKQNELANISINNEIERLKNEVDSIKERIVSYEGERQRIEDSVYFIANTQKAWHEFVEYISKSASQRGVDIESITTTEEPYEGQFALHKAKIDLKGSGDFHSVLKFIDSIESYGSFVEIEEIELKAEKEIFINLKITSWKIIL